MTWLVNKSRRWTRETQENNILAKAHKVRSVLYHGMFAVFLNYLMLCPSQKHF